MGGQSGRRGGQKNLTDIETIVDVNALVSTKYEINIIGVSL
jgi:hypothetical protein